jgi:hypothetical protein
MKSKCKNIYSLASKTYFRGYVLYVQYGISCLLLTRPKFTVCAGNNSRAFLVFDRNVLLNAKVIWKH